MAGFNRNVLGGFGFGNRRSGGGRSSSQRRGNAPGYSSVPGMTMEYGPNYANITSDRDRRGIGGGSGSSKRYEKFLRDNYMRSERLKAQAAEEMLKQMRQKTYANSLEGQRRSRAQIEGQRANADRLNRLKEQRKARQIAEFLDSATRDNMTPMDPNLVAGYVEAVGPQLAHAGLMQSGQLFAGGSGGGATITKNPGEDAPAGTRVDSETGAVSLPGGYGAMGGYYAGDLDMSAFPQYEKGISLVPETGPAILHENEAVISAPVVKKVMKGKYPKGTTNNEGAEPEWKRVLFDGFKKYKEGTGNKKEQEKILENVLDALQGPFFGGSSWPGPGMAHEAPTGGSELDRALFPEFTGVKGLAGNLPEIGAEELGEPAPLPEENEAYFPDPGSGGEMGNGAAPPPEGGMPFDPLEEDLGGAHQWQDDVITESVGKAGERKFTGVGDPMTPPKGSPEREGQAPLTAADHMKKQLDDLRTKAQSMYSSAMSLAMYANERPNSPASAFLRKQSAERMKAFKDLSAMAQQGEQQLMAQEEARAKTEAEEAAALADARAYASAAKSKAEADQMKSAGEGRAKGMQNVAELAKVLGQAEGMDPDQVQNLISQLIMFQIQNMGYGDVATQIANGG